MDQNDFRTTQLAGPANLAAPTKVVVKVGGEVKGEVSQAEKLGAVLKTFAEKAGIKSFAALVDGVRANSSQVNQTLAGVTEVDIIAKDARGSIN